jgi:hypothetical protein
MYTPLYHREYVSPSLSGITFAESVFFCLDPYINRVYLQASDHQNRGDESHEYHLWRLTRTRLDGSDRSDIYTPQRYDRLVGDTREYGEQTYHGVHICPRISLYHVREFFYRGVLFQGSRILSARIAYTDMSLYRECTHVLTLSYCYIWDLVFWVDTWSRTFLTGLWLTLLRLVV